MGHSSAGRKGAKSFWKKYHKDDKFREYLHKRWKNQRIDKEQKSMAGKLGAKARWKGHKKIKKVKKKKTIVFPENSFENKILKARICGYLAGDGCISIYKEKKKSSMNYAISFYPDHISMISPFIEAFETLYNRKPYVKKLKNYYSVRIKCKVACLDLLSITTFGTGKWRIPLDFLSEDSLKIEWIKSFFDCEAHVYKNENKKQLHLQSINKEGMHQLKELLEYFDISPKLYKYDRKQKNWKRNYLLFIMDKKSRKIYLDKIGFNHSIKQQRLEKQFAEVVESG